MRARRLCHLALMLALVGCAATEQAAAPAAEPTTAPSVRAESPYADPRTLEIGQILHIATGRLLSEAEALDYLSRFSVVYVGESHDNADNHALQLAVLRAIHERFPGQVALGLEMLQRSFQADATAFARGEMSEEEFRGVWQKSWGDDFRYYRDILLFVRDKRIPLIALNATTATRQAVREHPWSALPPDIARDVPEIDARDPYHRAYMESIFGGHGHGVTDPEAFYRVQLLWDETMAQTAADYLKSPAGQGRRLIVFAGVTHVRYGFGIPRRLFRRHPVPFAIVEPYVNESLVRVSGDKLMDVPAPAPPLAPADLYWAVGYRNLPDRVALGILIEESGALGVRVTRVLPGAPGDAAGVHAGDVIVSVDGTGVTHVSDVTARVSGHNPGDKGTLEVLRNGERLSLAVTYQVLERGK